MTIDPESFFRDRIEGMLSTASWVAKVKDLLGVEGVSQVWGEAPAWYFWISDAPGVYLFQLSAVSISQNDPKTARGTFAVKCYPYADRETFRCFSFLERDLVRSRFFDGTHTPRFEDREKIPDALFNVGVMEYAVGLDDDLACIRLESLDTLRIGYAKEAVQEYELIGKSRSFAKGETDRSVPGWQMGYLFFDRFLSLYAFYRKTTPLRLRLTRTPGFEYIYNGGDTFECVGAPDIDCLCASAYFGAADGHPYRNDFQARRPAEEDTKPDQAKVLYDQAFHCGHCHSIEKTADKKLSAPMRINPLWWSLADAPYKSELASACGCT